MCIQLLRLAIIDFTVTSLVSFDSIRTDNAFYSVIVKFNRLYASLPNTILGPVVQSVVSLTSSLRVISLTILADSIYNILIFFAEKM